MAEVIASDAKLRISLDTKQAADDLNKLTGDTGSPSAPGSGGPPSSGPGQQTGAPGGAGGDEAAGGGAPDRPEVDSPDNQARSPSSADRPYVGGPGAGNMSGRELWNRAQNAFGVVSSGRLYDTTLRALQSVGTVDVPFTLGAVKIPVGPAATAGEFVREYGAYGTGGMEALVKNLGLPEAVTEALATLSTEPTKVVQDRMNRAKNWSNAIGTALTAVQALAWGKSIKDEALGLDDVKDLADFGARVHASDVMFAEIDTRKRINFQTKMSGSLVNGLFEAVKGNAGR